MGRPPVKVSPIHARLSSEEGVTTRHLSDAGGLTQFGAYVESLDAGALSSNRHWHSAEDEFLYMLEGEATLIDDHGAHDLGPGDAVCWPHGNPNAHQISNRGTEVCRYVIVGTRVAGDVCHYPDSGRRLVNTATTWALHESDGTLVRGGDLPYHLRNLAPVWGAAFDPALAKPQVQRASSPWATEENYIHPILGGGTGAYSYQLLSDPGGLTQFGAFIEELPPGSASSFRHWHETEDEMVLILSGEVVLCEDAETPLRTGDAATWPAGHPVGHCLVNRSDAPARYLVIGTRNLRDTIHYSDHDLITHKDGTARRYTQADGTPRIAGEPR